MSVLRVTVIACGGHVGHTSERRREGVTGGGGKLAGIERFITDLNVYRADLPLNSVTSPNPTGKLREAVNC